MAKILFSDLDGTLLNSNKDVSEKNKEAIYAMTKAGNYFVINTGRPTASSISFAKELDLMRPGCFLVSFNGGVITDLSSGKQIFDARLDYGTVEELFRLAKEEDVYIQTYDGSSLIYSKEGSEVVQYKAGKFLNEIYAGDDVIGKLTQEPNKTILVDYHDFDKLDRFRKKYMGYFASRCDMFFSCPEYLEVMPKGVNKGGAVTMLTQYLRLSISESLAAGDERNDISMIRAAGVGVATKNAHPDVIAAADYVTENDCDHDAIAEIIDRFIL